MTMQNFNVYASRLVNKDENFTPGHRACVGCAEALAVRQVVKAIGRDVVVVNATGCMEVISSCYPNSAWAVPWIHTIFENASAVASGVESAIKVMRRKGVLPKDRRVKVVAIGGDGATADIGLQSLSGMLERGHDVLYVCFDNEAYMNTGIQRSSETPYGASTTTSPSGQVSIGQRTWKKNMPEIVAAHHVPYVATACPSYPFDLIKKVEKAMRVEGPSYIHVFSVCPTGWCSAPDLAVRMGRLAVLSGVFPLYEIEDGEWKLSMDLDKLTPVKEYFKGQGRFRHLQENDIEFIQKHVEKDWQNMRKRCGLK